MREQWKTIAELFGITAVVASLVFVGYEIGQNTSQLRTDGARSVTEMVNHLNDSIFSNAAFAPFERSEITTKFPIVAGIANFDKLHQSCRTSYGLN
jgi:hypothetical protein